MRLKPVLGVAALIAAAAAWYLFRPDALVLDRRVDEAPAVALGGVAPGANPAALLAMGKFHGVSHAGTGMVAIHRRADGTRVLRLSDLVVDNGPDLYVYLAAVPDAWDDATIGDAEIVSLGRLKGNQGNQNYEIPGDVDLGRFRSVSIWCRRFGVNFATAPLMLN
jgi:hypothetical protein